MIRNPEDKRKTRINISTPDFKNLIKKVPDNLEFFTLLGFTTSTNFLEFDVQYLNRLERVLALINSTLETLASQPTSFIMNAPGKRPETIQNPEPLENPELLEQPKTIENLEAIKNPEASKKSEPLTTSESSNPFSKTQEESKSSEAFIK